MRQVGWRSTRKSDVLEEARPNHSGLVPTASLSRSTTVYFTDLELLEYLVIASVFKHVRSTVSCLNVKCLRADKNSTGPNVRVANENPKNCGNRCRSKRRICKPSCKTKANLKPN